MVEEHFVETTSEKKLHINYLELLALLYLELKCFASDLFNCNILCRVDIQLQ